MTVEGQHFNLNVDQKNKSSLEAYLQAQGRTPDLYNTNDGGIKHADDKTIESIKVLCMHGFIRSHLIVSSEGITS
jgi:hypothetical protein